MLKKIIYYGRYKVFDILFNNIPHKILDILEKSNPFDISNDSFNYMNDVICSNTQNIKKDKEHDELFKL